MSDTPIHHVSDTAIWVAACRAQDSRRPAALFHDRFADQLVGALLRLATSYRPSSLISCNFPAHNL